MRKAGQFEHEPEPYDSDYGDRAADTEQAETGLSEQAYHDYGGRGRSNGGHGDRNGDAGRTEHTDIQIAETDFSIFVIVSAFL